MTTYNKDQTSIVGDVLASISERLGVNLVVHGDPITFEETFSEDAVLPLVAHNAQLTFQSIYGQDKNFGATLRQTNGLFGLDVDLNGGDVPLSVKIMMCTDSMFKLYRTCLSLDPTASEVELVGKTIDLARFAEAETEDSMRISAIIKRSVESMPQVAAPGASV